MPRAKGAGAGLAIRVRRPLSVPLPRETLRRITAAVLEREGLPADSAVTLAVVGERAIRRLNREFRAKDMPTDVLSFPLLGEPFPGPPDQPPQIGDVVICGPIAERQARDFGHSVVREVAYLYTHGLLHLLGYDHEQPEEQARMREREESALQAVGLPR